MHGIYWWAGPDYAAKHYLRAGLDVQEVCARYLAVYVDAFEWVELKRLAGEGV